MRTRRALLIAVLALCGAAALTWATTPMSATERIIRIEAAEALPHLAGDLDRWSVEVNAVMREYAGDEQLRLAAQLALITHPQAAEAVIGQYGTTDAFKQVLRRYGAAVVLPIHYYMNHESLALRLRHQATNAFDADEGTARGTDTDTDQLTAAERGWYAIGFIDEQGYDFLGQFVVAPDGAISWVQTERFATSAKRFFTSGLTGLESKWHRGQEIGAGDYAWAAVDVMVPVAAFRVAKAARAGRLAGVGGRSLRLARPVGAATTLATAGYLVTHPSLLSNVAEGVAEALSLPAWLVETALWFVLLLPLLIAVRVLYRWLLRPLRRLLLTSLLLLRWLHRRGTARAQAS